MAGKKREAIDLETLSRGERMLVFSAKVMSGRPARTQRGSHVFPIIHFKVVIVVAFVILGYMCLCLSHPLCVYPRTLRVWAVLRLCCGRGS